jgi:hypothetical protein
VLVAMVVPIDILMPEHSPFEVEIAIAKLKKY